MVASVIDFLGLSLSMFPGLQICFLARLPGAFLIRVWLRSEVRFGHRSAVGSPSAELRCQG